MLMLASIAGYSAPARASDTLIVNDTSQLEWIIYSGKTYFRNFNAIDPTWLGCCYNYYFDLTTDEGGAMFSAFLTYQSLGRTMMFNVTSKSVAGPIVQFGKF